MIQAKVYDPMIDFIVSGMPPEQIIAFRPPKSSMERLESLINKKKVSELSKEENSELDHFLFLEHIFRLAKARARKRLMQ
ncbi:MAG: hypothetical protein AAGJ18_16375 [Bacteroidota bacterium]